jgi:hypothetical protein
MTAMKFRVNSPEHSEQIQKKLFEMGYKWALSGASVIETNAKYLWAGSLGDKYITHGYNDEDFFNAHPVEEYLLTPQGTFAKREDYYKQPETNCKCFVCEDQRQNAELYAAHDGLKPKKIHDQQRLLEIIDAMSRYASTGNAIPAEWFAEAQYLNGLMESE